MTQRKLVTACVVVAMGGLVGAAFGQQQEATPKLDDSPASLTLTPAPAEARRAVEIPEEGWKFTVEPAGWFVGAGGRLKMPRTTAIGSENQKTNLTHMNFDNPRFVPLLEVNAVHGDWRLAVRGFDYEATRNASGRAGALGDVGFTAADTINSKLRFGSYEIEGGYKLAGKGQNLQEDGSYAINPRLDGILGARIIDVDWDIRRTTPGASPSTVSESNLSVQTVAGVKFTMDFGRDATIDVQVAGGALPTSSPSYTFDIIVGFMWKPFDHWGVQVGYRSMFFGVSRGSGETSFSFNGAMQGLYGGLVISF